MRILAALAALLVAGCAGGTPARDLSPAERACRTEGEANPALRELDRRRNPANPTNMARLDEEASAIVARAYRDCLRRNGLASGGGVEPIRR